MIEGEKWMTEKYLDNYILPSKMVDGRISSK